MGKPQPTLMALIKIKSLLVFMSSPLIGFNEFTWKIDFAVAKREDGRKINYAMDPIGSLSLKTH